MNKETGELLKTYMELSLQIRPNRIVSDLSSNEAMILSLLMEEQEKEVTSTLIGERFGMLKSQVNRYTDALEKQGMITRTRSEKDRRKVILEATEHGRKTYAAIHLESMAYAQYISARLGREKTEQLTALLKEALSAVYEKKEGLL